MFHFFEIATDRAIDNLRVRINLSQRARVRDFISPLGGANLISKIKRREIVNSR